MKKILILMLFVLGFSELVAQKITQKKDVILVDGKPYLNIIKENNGYKVIYKIKTLDNKIIILATATYGEDNEDNNDTHFELTFVETNEKAYLNAVIAGMGKKIAKELHSNNVITGNTISNEGKKIFLIIHGKKPQNTLKNDNQNNSNNNDNNDNNSSNNLVQRDRNANIFIFGEKIEQDFKKIGTIIAETTASNGGINYIYKFYSPNGTMAAEATYAGMDSNECIVITFKDSRRHRITAKRTAESPKNIIEMLVREYYL